MSFLDSFGRTDNQTGYSGGQPGSYQSGYPGYQSGYPGGQPSGYPGGYPSGQPSLPTGTPASPIRKSRSASRGWIVLVVVLALLIGAACGVDLYVRKQTEQTVATQVSTVFTGLEDPDITIHGFPFLTQLLRGRLGHVTGTTDKVVLDGYTSADVRVDARDVTASPPRAGTATVSATIGTQTATELLRSRSGIKDLTLRVEGDHLVMTMDVSGRELALTGVVRVEPGVVRFDLGQATLGGVSTELSALPSGLQRQLGDLSIPVGGLPSGVVLNGVDVVPDGVRFTATGTDVPLTR